MFLKVINRMDIRIDIVSMRMIVEMIKMVNLDINLDIVSQLKKKVRLKMV